MNGTDKDKMIDITQVQNRIVKACFLTFLLTYSVSDLWCIWTM